MIQGRLSCFVLAVFTFVCIAAADAPATGPSDAEAKYNDMLVKRIDDIVVALNLNDSAKAERVRELLNAQYRGLRARHDSRDTQISSVGTSDKDKLNAIKAEAVASVQALHGEFLSRLANELSQEQIDVVKNKMTYNKVGVTYNAYLEMLPSLTDPQKQTIHGYLIAAREDAIDGGSSEEKAKIFDKAKGKINNYLSREGYDLKQASKDWTARRKAAAAKQGGGN